MATTRITILVENTARGSGLMAEHGVAYWIEQKGRYLLFDSGQGGVLVHNARKLGIPLAKTEALILSHGHYDHTGGVADALKGCQSVSVYAHPSALARKYAPNAKGSIGIPQESEKVIRNPLHRLIATTQPTPVCENLMVTGPVPRITDFEDTGGQFFLDVACTQPDLLEDDQSVFFNTQRGTVVLLGCAHSGIINTLWYIRQLTGNRPIHMVLGGTHLVNASSYRIERTIEELRKMGVERIAPAHCTGMPATVALWNAFPGQCQACPVGARFEFD